MNYPQNFYSLKVTEIQPGMVIHPSMSYIERFKVVMPPKIENNVMYVEVVDMAGNPSILQFNMNYVREVYTTDLNSRPMTRNY